MARVKFKNTKDFSKRLNKQFSAFTSNDEEMEKIAKIIRTELVANLRSGIGGDDELLPSLRNSTVNRRGALASVNRTSSKYMQSFSNVTFSGKFVKAIKVMATKTAVLGSRRFEFIFAGSHKGYKNLNGTKGQDTDNGTIFKNLTKLGYKLTGVTASANIRIKKQFIRFLRRAKKKR
jgi:hypothetical protein